MKVAGFTFIRNAVTNDYPIVAAITSILPLCDEFVVAVGNGNDGTRALIENIKSPKIKIIDTLWDDDLREGGRVFALETDKAFAAIAKDIDWAFYIQGDECVHEKYLPLIKAEMQATLSNPNIEGLLFKYLHFYGSYDYVGQSRRWYRREIRVVKRNLNVQSYRDAQGFRIDNRKIKVKLIDAYIYHYGWVKPPEGLKNKLLNFNQFYQSAEWIATNLPQTFEFDYSNADRLVKFEGEHPTTMLQRIKTCNWKFTTNPLLLKNKMSLRRRILQKIEDITSWRVSEYRNYKVV
ncbi:MAG: glycosyltransferase family 2 protein [Sphingobacteriales bacterium]|nr:MAG: glycosyltransferase family 2 protein [Sphingobacteriales bacterium]TAF82683.1 MAG: glycosyltransferase family 2 protein [Sphingobacteriales bacterium]